MTIIIFTGYLIWVLKLVTTDYNWLLHTDLRIKGPEIGRHCLAQSSQTKFYYTLIFTYRAQKMKTILRHNLLKLQFFFSTTG